MGIESPDLSPDEVLKAALAIRRHDFEPSNLALIRRIIDEDYDWLYLLIRKLVHAGGAEGLDYEDSAAQAQHDLEDLLKVDALAGCVLMARLWPIVNSILGMHQESDAIGLSLDWCKDPELVKYLEREAEREEDPTSRKWIVEAIGIKRKKS